MGSITAANSVIVLGAAGIYNTPQRLQGYAADDIFSTEDLQLTETQMGVDGFLSAGLVFNEIKQAFNLQADSNSNQIFETITEAMKAAKDIYWLNATITLPSLRRKWTMTNGVITTYPPMPSAGKTLKPRKYSISWESMSPSPA